MCCKSLLLFLFVWSSLASAKISNSGGDDDPGYSSNGLFVQNPCVKKTTCGECMQTPTCAWCMKEVRGQTDSS